MTSLRARLAELVEGATFPLDKAELIELVQRSGDQALLDIVVSIADDHYVDVEELDHRIEDALGMPDAIPAESAIDPDTAWQPEDR
jgi:hypothetical protein